MRAIPGLLGLILLATIIAGPAAARDLPPEQVIPPESSSIVPRSPSLFGRTSLRLALGLGVAALATAEYDDAGAMIAAFDGSPLDTGMLDVADIYGEGATLGLVSLGFLAAGTLGDRPRVSAVGEDLSRSLLGSWAVVWALKLTIGTRRPNGGRYSFPSGHTATAFAAAPVLSRHFGTVAGIAAYSMAGMTALARMEDGKHYPRDVLAGAAIGLVMGDLLSSSPAGSLSLAPGPGGLALSVRF